MDKDDGPIPTFAPPAYETVQDLMQQQMSPKGPGANSSGAPGEGGALPHHPVMQSDSDVVFDHITNGLIDIYRNKVMALEDKFLFPSFHSAILTDGELRARPMVMLMGQYSVGKTTFIRHLLGQDFRGARIGPEPTTDRFMALLAGPEEKTIPGNALALEPTMPFGGLSSQGTGFLSKFEACVMPSPLLERITLIDTPGVLSGEKQRVGRNYNFPEVVKWFADRVDRILLLFDAHKLDISDEFKMCIDQLRGHDDKIRVVLNKSDSVDPQQLMRVHGALMWSLGKCFNTPEVCRVYLGSFWDRPINPVGAANAELFEAEKKDLIDDLRSLPKNAALRKVNEFIKRVRMARTHALIIGHLQNEMPMLWGKDDKQKELIDGLHNEFNKASSPVPSSDGGQVRIQYNIPVGDFPHMGQMQAKLRAFGKSFRDLPSYSKSKILRLQEALDIDIPRLIQQVPGMTSAQPSRMPGQPANPFEAGSTSKTEQGGLQLGLIDPRDKAQFERDFGQLGQGQPKLDGGRVAGHFERSFPSIPREGLARIWALADIDRDGLLDAEEFCIGMHLCCLVVANAGDPNVLPAALPLSLVPPSKY